MVTMVTSSKLRMRLLNNVERLQLRFNIPNILENKRNVEWMLKQSLKAFKGPSKRLQHLLQHPFDFVERCWKVVE